MKRVASTSKETVSAPVCLTTVSIACTLTEVLVASAETANELLEVVCETVIGLFSLVDAHDDAQTNGPASTSASVRVERGRDEPLHSASSLVDLSITAESPASSDASPNASKRRDSLQPLSLSEADLRCAGLCVSVPHADAEDDDEELEPAELPPPTPNSASGVRELECLRFLSAGGGIPPFVDGVPELHTELRRLPLLTCWSSAEPIQTSEHWPSPLLRRNIQDLHLHFLLDEASTLNRHTRPIWSTVQPPVMLTTV